jgi:hypothetical protein
MSAIRDWAVLAHIDGIPVEEAIPWLVPVLSLSLISTAEWLKRRVHGARRQLLIDRRRGHAHGDGSP